MFEGSPLGLYNLRMDLTRGCIKIVILIYALFNEMSGFLT